jgi:hypothetical protein
MVGKFSRALRKGAPEKVYPPVTSMLALLRSAEFDVDGGATVSSGPDARKWLAQLGAGQLQNGEVFRQSWLDAGITEDETEQTLFAMSRWADTDDAWYAALQCEMLTWK